MKGLWKFIALAVAGFALGAVAAWLQQPHPVSTTTPPTLQQNIAAMSKPAAKTENPARQETAKADATSGDDGLTAAPAEKKDNAPALTTSDKGDELTAPPSTDEKADAAATAAPKEEAVSPDVAKNIAAAKGEPTASGVGGHFSLIDDNGNPVTDKSWPGKYLLVYFGFTNCPDVCPVTLDKLTAVLHQLGDDADKVQTLFITVDAARDKPNVLKDYVGHFHKSILGLTGTEAQLKEAQQAYKVYTARHDQPNGHDYSFDHSSYVFFMAPDGKLAEILQAEDKPSDIADKIRPYLEGQKQPASPAP